MRLGRILRSCAWVLFESIVVCGPSQAAGITLASPGAAAFPIVDADSRPIIVNSFAQRVVTLAPSLTELMYATGAGEKLIGVSAYSDFPAAVAVGTGSGLKWTRRGGHCFLSQCVGRMERVRL